jgi:hypothetical protein
VYAIGTLETLWFPKDENGRPTLGWGRVVSHILGKPTIFAS